MTQTLYNVTAIGNAIVDLLAFVDEEFIRKHKMPKGHEILIGQELAEVLYHDMPPSVAISGGSAANTIAGIASFGGKAAFIGKVKNDQLGKIFAHDILSLGVHFPTSFATEGSPTGRCFVVVTPDAQRTMCAYLGASDAITLEDIDENVIAASQILYIEGYLLYQPHLKGAITKAISIAKAYGRKVALTLSDSLCVEHNHTEFMELVCNKVDILFANETEIKALLKTTSLDKAITRIAELCEITAITRGGKGSVILSGAERYHVEAAPVGHVVDTTGAGDLYASGFLYGLTHGRPLPECGRLGSLAAAEVISHLGARAETELRGLV